MKNLLEKFSPDQEKVLEKYVTNISENIFALRNLPEVIKGALFSRYSRSTLGLRSLLLKEFILNKEESFLSEMATEGSKESEVAVQKAQGFYDRILDGYGDDSIGELGGTHLAIENVSMIAAKAIEDCRIGGSPLEKSSRYVPFDQKVNGEYLFYKEPTIMQSKHGKLYYSTCNLLFETYSKLIPVLTSLMEKKFPKDAQMSSAAYNAALRAKVFDCIRGLLPASALTNLGLFGNGRFFEHLLQKLQSRNLSELKEVGTDIFQELSKVIPSFVRRAAPLSKYQTAFAQFQQNMHDNLKMFASTLKGEKLENSVSLIDYDSKCVSKIIAALLFEHTEASMEQLQKWAGNLSEEQQRQILEAAAKFRENRRHKSPRALELASFTFETVSDFGAFRDLQRHRILTQDRQLLTCNLGYFIPPEIIGTDMEQEYREAMEKAQEAYNIIAKDFKEEAQYIVPMGYNVHWYFHINLRSLQWLCELRSSAAGHANYRKVAQEMCQQICSKLPLLSYFFKFVDFAGYDLGRAGQEERKVQKQRAANVV